MPVYTTALPQQVEEIKTILLGDLISVLPEQIDYPISVWLTGKIVRYGITSGNLVFLSEQNTEPSVELKLYFSSLVKSLGIDATISNSFQDAMFTSLQLYDQGELIIDKGTLNYKKLPAKRPTSRLLTVEQVLNSLPQEIEWKQTICLTGGTVKLGWSANDADFVILDEPVSNQICKDIRDAFGAALGWKVHVGTTIMGDREPVYLYKIYENGKLCPPQP